MVYGELRRALLEEVYRHAVEQARLGPVLTQLDDALGALCAATPQQLHPGAASALCRSPCPSKQSQSKAQQLPSKQALSLYIFTVRKGLSTQPPLPACEACYEGWHTPTEITTPARHGQELT